MTNIGRRARISEHFDDMDLSLLDIKQLSGKLGTIICETTDKKRYGIQFDEPITEHNSDGYNCDGRGKNGYCLYINKEEVIVIFNVTTTLDNFSSVYKIMDEYRSIINFNPPTKRDKEMILLLCS
jgi:hypothetical protein